MLIGKNYKVESDNLNVILSEWHKPSKKKDGTMTKGLWTPIGFYSRIDHALQALVNMKVKETELNDLKTVLTKIEEVEKEIMEAIKNG